MAIPAVPPQFAGEGDNARANRLARMFCVVDSKVLVADPPAASHYDWFVREKWIAPNGSNEEKFFQHVVSGYHVPGDDAIYCFHEMEFTDQAELTSWLIRHVAQLKHRLGLRSGTKVFIGPRADEPHGFGLPSHYVGTVGALIKQAEE